MKKFFFDTIDPFLNKCINRKYGAHKYDISSFQKDGN